MYSADDGNIEVFYFKNSTATFPSFTHKPEARPGHNQATCKGFDCKKRSPGIYSK